MIASKPLKQPFVYDCKTLLVRLEGLVERSLTIRQNHHSNEKKKKRPKSEEWSPFLPFFSIVFFFVQETFSKSKKRRLLLPNSSSPSSYTCLQHKLKPELAKITKMTLQTVPDCLLFEILSYETMTELFVSPTIHILVSKHFYKFTNLKIGHSNVASELIKRELFDPKIVTKRMEKNVFGRNYCPGLRIGSKIIGVLEKTITRKISKYQNLSSTNFRKWNLQKVFSDEHFSTKILKQSCGVLTRNEGSIVILVVFSLELCIKKWKIQKSVFG